MPTLPNMLRKQVQLHRCISHVTTRTVNVLPLQPVKESILHGLDNSILIAALASVLLLVVCC